MIVGLMLSALLAQGAVAGAPSPLPGVISSGAGGVASAVAPRADDAKVVCRREEETGSRVNSHRSCMTNLEWRERAAQSRDSIDAIQRAGNHAFGG